MHFRGMRRAFRTTAVIAAVGIGLVLGASAFTFGYARGYSYLTNDPAACANCHVMTEHFSAWMKSSHREVARCNDCHAPHSVAGKYLTKARNGFWHSFYFTIGRYPDPLRITPRNQRITEGACRHCHSDIVDAIDPKPSHDAGAARTDQMLLPAHRPGDSCIRCHAYVGHFVR